MKHSAHVQLRHVLFTQWMKISLNILHPEGSGLLHVLLIHMSVSLLSMGKSKTQQLLLNCYFPEWCCPDAPLLWPLWPVNTQWAQHQSTFTFRHFNVYPCLHIYFLWTFLVSNTFGKGKLTVSSQVKCNGNFRECTCILNVCFDEDMPKLGDPWRLFGKTKVREI